MRDGARRSHARAVVLVESGGHVWAPQTNNRRVPSAQVSPGVQQSSWALLGGLAAEVVVAASVFEGVLAQALVRSKQDVLGHVGRESARRRAAAERLGEAAHVVGSGAATDAEVAHAEVERVLRERGDLVAIAHEWIERGGERAIV